VTRSFLFWLPPLLYLLLATCFLWRSTFTGEVFLPAKMLGHIAPYTAQANPAELPLWNPLRWDGIAQFYPWRHFAGETLRAGTLPLWNPYQFCGTPFVANSQSAVFYPPNLLFAALPTARAFHVNALLHLTLCGWFTYLLLRRLRLSDFAALLSGVAFAYSSWQVAWLQLPTFLATSCWFPLVLREVIGYRFALPGQACRSRISVPMLGCAVGMMLLAGHLQIAFYGLLAGSLWAIAHLLAIGKREGAGKASSALGRCLGGLALGVMLAAPQMLPSIELSRVSHRVGRPTSAGYKAYTEYALPVAGLSMLTLPNFFGNDYDPNNPYWGFYLKDLGEGNSFALRHNAAETANYVGIVTLLLGFLAVARHFRRRGETRVWFFAGLAVLALLLALGTPLNALFYFGVPGFGQSGSPARCLVLWALAWAVLAGFGLEALLESPPSRREAGIALGSFALVFVVGISSAARSISSTLPGFEQLKTPLLGEALPRLTFDWIRLGVFTLCGAGLLLGAERLAQRPGVRLNLLAPAMVGLVTADLFLAGLWSNPTAPLEAVYPVTPGLKLLQERLNPHERLFPVNREWSLYTAPPAALPPNAAMVYGFRDVQGYDSLLTGQYKAFANEFARADRFGNRDASPPEVGNMVFMQNANAPKTPLLGAAWALSVPTGAAGFVPEAIPPGEPIYNAEKEMAIYTIANALPRARQIPTSPATEKSSYPPITWVEDTPNRITLRTGETQEPTLLALADQFYPGWKATEDGLSVAIQRMPDAPFRQVFMPPGAHTVTFRYDPASIRLGLFLACFSVLLICTLTTCARLLRS
jgi:hypothetical protein